MSPSTRLARRIARARLDPELLERLERLAITDQGHGYDLFGAHRDWVALGLTAFQGLYERYFRVLSYGIENVPKAGGAILASNHSGTLPFDGTMIFEDLLRRTDPPRLPRPVADFFVTHLPGISTFFSRVGVVAGSRLNVETLLENGELLMIFPEGTPGISKAFKDRYQLQHWREGHAELALRHQVPVIPVAVIGAEEQMPQIACIDRVHPFGIPYIPITLTPFPMPVRYHIHYGEPIALHERWSADQSSDPEIIREAALVVKQAVQALIDRGLEMREGVFR